MMSTTLQLCGLSNQNGCVITLLLCFQQTSELLYKLPQLVSSSSINFPVSLCIKWDNNFCMFHQFWTRERSFVGATFSSPLFHGMLGWGEIEILFESLKALWGGCSIARFHGSLYLGVDF